MIMDVNQPQNPGEIHESNIRKELRQRKYLVKNQQIEEIKPFKTYRKPIDQQDTLQQTNNHHKPVEKYNSQSVKLRREYPTDPIITNDPQIGLKQTKYRYDIDSKDVQNQPPLQQNTHYQKKTYPETIYKSQLEMPMIRKNIKNLQAPFLVGTNGGRKEVQSIIFDSKITKIEDVQEKYVRSFTVGEDFAIDRNIKVFQEKVDQVNSQIEAGLTNLQKMVEQLKKKKVAQSQIQTQLKVKSRLQELERQFTQRRAERRQKQKDIAKQPVKQTLEKQKQIKNDLIQNLIESQKKLGISLEKAASPPKTKDEGIADSLIQLQGDINNKASSFPTEYISFINRLANQIQKDIQFTNKISELTKSNQIQAIKDVILQELKKHKSQDFNVDQTFFQLQPSEIDPLDQGKPGWYKKFSNEAFQKEALKVYKMYKDIDSHFRLKLEGKFSLFVLRLLFQELAQFNFTKNALNDSDCVTVGHLLSYLNMRTNKSFRNRSFVKMLKRLGLRSNSFLNINSFGKLIIQ